MSMGEGSTAAAESAMPSLYDFPDVYEAVLIAPAEQTDAEVGSIAALMAAHGAPRGRVLELACGPCPHGIRLARLGHAVLGIDLSPAMLAFAARRAAAEGLPLETERADIIDFRLGTEPFDCAIFMAETFPLLTEYEQLVRHFASVARHVRPGGLYIIDVDAHRHGVCTEYAVWGERTVPLRRWLRGGVARGLPRRLGAGH